MSTRPHAALPDARADAPPSTAMPAPRALKRKGVASVASASAPASTSASTVVAGNEGDAPAPFKHRNLPLLLLHAREGVIAHFRPVLNQHGVTEQQWRIVRALLERGPLEPRQIVTVCHISSPSLAGVLARMDEMGLVTRARVAHDQRRLMVALTDKSRALAASMAPQIEAIYDGIEAHIGREVVGRFYAALDELIGMLGELPGAAGS